jgi:hypothetical protein
MGDADVARIAQACNSQLQNEVALAWDIKEPLTVTAAPSAGAGSYPFFFVDDIPEAPGALAYHFVQANGVPAGKIGVKTTQSAGESVSSATSHEAIELQCDIYCATWSFSSRLRCLVATEACDPVQSGTYDITVEGSPVQVSNFVTPAYFTDNPLGRPLDHLGLLSQTFAIAHGGYQIQMKAGRVHNVFGEGFPDALRAGKEASQGRTFWRAVTMALVMQSR